jgi:predicted permease
MLPHAEREEVLGDLADEYAQKRAAGRLVGARLWLWRQVLGSLPALMRRGWWRGWTGFEPRANRAQPGGPMFESWIMDLRYSARRLASRPTYTLLAVLTLALGAGGTAAIYSVVREVLIKPLPIEREGQVGVLWFGGSWTEQEFLRFRPSFPGFQAMAAYRPDDATLELPGQALRFVHGVATSAELFDVLGAHPMLGRTFQVGDDRLGAERVALLSHGLWQELGAEPSIVGRQVQLGGAARTVVGVMPAGFWFPEPTVKVWTAEPLNPENRSGMYTLIGRVEDGKRVEAMQGPIAALAKMLAENFQYPAQWDKTKSPSVTPVREVIVGDVRPSLVAMLSAMALILGIACVNVTALMLGQLGGRSTEMAVRSALGAGRQRLVQQLVAEALLVGLLAGAAGAGLAAGSFRLLVGALPLGALAESARLSWTLFWAATAFALVASAVIAIVPAAVVWRRGPQSGLSTSRTGGVSVRGGRLEGGLVVAQIALAVLLTAGAGLLIRSVANLRAIDPGFDTRAGAVVAVNMPAQLAPAERRRILLDAIPALQGLPGVKAVGATQKLPLTTSGNNWGITIPSKPDLASSTTAFRIVSRDYFRAMHAEIRHGRGFLPSDREDTEMVVVVNEALAAKYFAGEDAVGQVIRTGFRSQSVGGRTLSGGAPIDERIIGVVENMAEADLTDPPTPARYMLIDQVPYIPPDFSLVLAASSPQEVPVVLQAARATLQTAASRMALQQTTTLASVLDRAVGASGRVATLLALLAGLALILSAVGVYGVISHAVSRRRRDYAICMALGLEPRRVVSQVLRRGMTLAALGSAAGIVATLLFMRPLASLLYGVGQADPAALAGSVLALLIVGTVATLVPARRASRTDPAVVLRQD